MACHGVFLSVDQRLTMRDAFLELRLRCDLMIKSKMFFWIIILHFSKLFNISSKIFLHAFKKRHHNTQTDISLPIKLNSKCPILNFPMITHKLSIIQPVFLLPFLPRKHIIKKLHSISLILFILIQNILKQCPNYFGYTFSLLPCDKFVDII